MLHAHAWSSLFYFRQGRLLKEPPKFQRRPSWLRERSLPQRVSRLAPRARCWSRGAAGAEPPLCGGEGAATVARAAPRCTARLPCRAAPGASSPCGAPPTDGAAPPPCRRAVRRPLQHLRRLLEKQPERTAAAAGILLVDWHDGDAPVHRCLHQPRDIAVLVQKGLIV